MSIKKWYDQTAEKKRVENSLEKTKSNLFGTISKYLLGKRSIDDAFLDDLEDVLISADVGVKTTVAIVDQLRNQVRRQPFRDEKELMKMLHQVVADLVRVDSLKTTDFDAFLNHLEKQKPYVFLIVGINGVGKTTTIGKLANQFKSHGKKVVLGASDTFRAAAAEQLTIWSQRADVRIVRHQDNADPASVAFDTVSSAVSRGEDIVIIDTAGRLHNKSHLMEELNKIQRSIDKALPGAPHDVWLVLDASTGQNALVQAKEFSKVVHISGLILTKLDGTAKGGVVLGISNELKMPVRFIGVGEQMDDLRPFDAEIFIEALFEGIEK